MSILIDKNTDITGSIIVAYDYKKKTNTAILIVGQKAPGADAKVINAFDGEEATELWNRLTTTTEKK